jgi:hypothetical protein
VFLKSGPNYWLLVIAGEEEVVFERGSWQQLNLVSGKVY